MDNAGSPQKQVSLKIPPTLQAKAIGLPGGGLPAISPTGKPLGGASPINDVVKRGNEKEENNAKLHH